tara:strand:- start:13534 stop:14004 length:471 start_codon:yes stop_codon:yes gene_type:complete
MKHKQYEMIVAKASNMDLVVFVKGKATDTWVLRGEQSTTTFFYDVEYFLCLPQHKEAVLHALNGGQSQATNEIGEGKYQDVYVGKPDIYWTSGGWYMSDVCESRIKPKKEKRWIVLQYDQDLKDWCFEDGTLYKTVEDAEDNRRYGQLAEIEVEVF